MSVEIIQGHWVDSLRRMPDKHFQMAATSPPYYGLRSYLPKDHPLKSFELGAEASPDEYVSKLVEGFREVRRVLRDDGVLWLNLGDSYAGSGKSSGQEEWLGGDKQRTNKGSLVTFRTPIGNGSKPKDLLGIPWLVAFALRADGWYLRSACPWIKRAAMPESVTDRPGSACEMIFLLSKSDRYYYDHEAVKIPAKCAGQVVQLGEKSFSKRQADGAGVAPTGNGNADTFTVSPKRNLRNTDWFWDTWQGMLPGENGDPLAFVVNPKPYRKAHFATFAPKLVEPMILSSTSEKGCCMICESPWERVVEKQQIERGDVYGGSKFNGSDPNFSHTRIQKMIVAGRALGLPHDNPQLPTITTGWRPTCDCNCEYTIPCRVLDPFGGVATTGMVCEQLGRDCTCLELNPEYIPLAQERIATMK